MNLTKSITYIFIMFILAISIATSCKKKILGCTDITSPHYNENANIDNGECLSWSEEIAGIYNGIMDCNLLSNLDGEFQLTIISVDNDNVQINMNINGLQSLPIQGTVEDNKITFVPFKLDGFDFELPNLPVSAKGIEINGDLTYILEGKKLEGNLKITVITDILPISDNCSIEATKS